MWKYIKAMSIATLKRKTQVKYNNMSVGQNGFSLNGTRRSAGYVGQDMLGRCLVRSLSRGGALKGHGGCCGTYPISQIKSSPEMACLNNPNVVKMSSLNNSGLIATKYSWINRPRPITTWKPLHRHCVNSQSLYIDNLAREVVKYEDCNKNVNTPIETCCKIAGRNYNYNTIRYPKVLPPNKTGAMGYAEYIQGINKKCGVNPDLHIIRNTKGVPFSCKKKVS
jgi:hypothetical protein